MRKGLVYYKNRLAGIISEDDDGYFFHYDKIFMQADDAKPISLTLPFQNEQYQSKVLFPFFDGLIPEGWLLNIAVANWKINSRDRFGLLLTLCRDCIGCVSITNGTIMNYEWRNYEL
jgi:serine/threonine-protein kinase HipA